MKKTWVVAAESSRARIFQAESRLKPMKEIEGLAHPESRARVLDINADNAGRAFDRAGQGRHAMENEVDPKKHEAEMFAKQIAEHLDKARAKGEFEDVIVVAAPEFLGLLRKHVNPITAKMVSKTVTKNLVRETEEVIRKAALALE